MSALLTTMTSICFAAEVPGPACHATPSMSLLQFPGDESKQMRTSLLQGPRKSKKISTAKSVPKPGPAPPPKVNATLVSSNSGNSSGNESLNGLESDNASSTSSLNSTDPVVEEKIVDLSANATQGINLSGQMAPGPPPLLTEQAPYNSSNNATEEIIMKPMKAKGAKTLPALDPANLTGILRDCIMGMWSEWSDCVLGGSEGRAGSLQRRSREVVQPWLEGGKPCGTTIEAQDCELFSVANAMVGESE